MPPTSPDQGAVAPGAAAPPSGAAQAAQAATSQREAARRSFESQRTALMETIKQQRRTMSESAAKALRPPAPAESRTPLHCSDEAWAHLAAACDAGDRLVMSLALMGVVPGMTGSQETQAQCAVAARRFLDALKILIAEEIAVAKREWDAGAATPTEAPDAGGARPDR